MRVPRVPALVLVPVLALGGLAACGEQRAPGPQEPVVRASTHGASIDEAARACARCHPHEAEAWTHSAHALQGTPRQQPEGGANAAVGSRWMQAYLRQDEAGLHRIQPRCYDLRDGVWRDVPAVLFEIGGGQSGTQPLTLGELSARSFELECSGCHASGTQLRYDSLAERYAATWRSLAIDCAACHGATPGHGEAGSARAVALGSLPPRARTLVCGRCHGGPPVRGDLEPSDAGAFVGRLGDRTSLFADGTASGQVYQLSAFLRSPCHLEGGLACTGCHDPHGPDQRAAGGTDALCVRCHEGFASPEHTHHPPASTGARCLECHMPRLLGGLMHHQRDHRIGVPLPALPDQPDACTACHADKDEAWADAAARAWWGDPSRERLASAATVAAARRGDNSRDALTRLLTQRDPFFRAAAITHLPEAAGSLVDDPLPEVRLAALHALGRLPRSTPLLQRLAGLDGGSPGSPGPGAPDGAFLRGRALLALAERGEPVPEARRADIECVARLDRGDLASRRLLVRWALEHSRWAEALRWLEELLAQQPVDADAWFRLAEVRFAQAEHGALDAAARNGVRAAFATLGSAEAAGRAVEAVASSAVSRGHRGLAAAVLGAAAEHAPVPALRQHFGLLLSRLRRML